MTGERAPLGLTPRSALSWLLDRVFAIRPLLWIPAVAVYGAGFAWGSRGQGREGFSPGPLAALLLILAAVHAGNAWRDRAGDRVNRKRIPVGSGFVGGRSLLMLSLGSILVAALLARGASVFEQGLLLVSLLLGLAYVAPPLEFKRRPFLDVFSHGAGYGIVAFLLGAGASGPDGASDLRPALIAALPYALGIMTVSLLTMLADLEGDERVGQRTTAVALGSRRTAAASSALAWGTMGTGLLAGELTPTLWGALAAGLLALRPEPARTADSWNTFTIRLQLLFLLLLAPQTPAPLVAAIVIGGAAEGYNRWRWGVGYPFRAVGSERGMT